MEFYQKLESTIDWNKPVDAQLDKLAQYDRISHEEILELAKCFKWTEAGILIEYLGFQKLKWYSNLFLEFLQDINWPAAHRASKMLVEAGREILPEIRRIFNQVKDDSVWHMWILMWVVSYFDKSTVDELKLDLISLIDKADKDGASIQALRILTEKELLPDNEVYSILFYCFIIIFM